MGAKIPQAWGKTVLVVSKFWRVLKYISVYHSHFNMIDIDWLSSQSHFLACKPKIAENTTLLFGVKVAVGDVTNFHQPPPVKKVTPQIR